MQKRHILSVAATAGIFAGFLLGCEQPKTTPATRSADNTYTFERGYPSGDTARQAMNDTDFQRAVQAYRFWYPTVSAR